MNTRLCQNAEPLFFAQKNTPEKRGAALVLVQLPNWSAAVRTYLGILTHISLV